MTTPIIVFGAGGHAKVVLDLLRSEPNYQVLGVIDNHRPGGSDFYGTKILGSDRHALDLMWSDSKIQGIVAVGCNGLRRKIVQFLFEYNPAFQFISAIAPSAIISSSAQIHSGTVVMPGVIINADVKIGKHCIVNTAASLDHDCVLKEYVSLSPHVALAGGVSVGKGAFLGAGVVVIPGKTIGAHAVLGAGAVVVTDIQPNTTAFGVPATMKGSAKSLGSSATKQADNYGHDEKH